MVRVGLVGCGGRGQSLLDDLLGIEKVEVKALCDVVPERIAEAERLIAKRGGAAPATFAKGDHDFLNLCRRDDLDVVYIATPWSWHVPMALAAMNAGKHAFVEVPAATTLEDCWKLVDASERTRRHCVMLENCCYGYNELLVLNLVRAGLLGRADPRRGRLPPRPAQAPVRGQGRGPLAPGRALRPERQPLPHPRARAGGELPRHQPRRPVRAARLHELARAEPHAPTARPTCPRAAPSRPRPTAAAT